MIDRTFKTFIVIAIVILTGLIGFGIQQIEEEHAALHAAQTTLHRVEGQQQEDREAAILKNVQARKSDCENGAIVRNALRENVIQGEKQLPLILKLLPSLNTHEILEQNKKTVARELQAFKPIDCTAYALKAAPDFEKHKITLEEQQAELRRTEQQLHEIVRKSAETRVNTVSQRCELTGLIARILKKQDRHDAPSFVRSYQRCQKQLAEVKKIAASAK